MSNTNTGGPAFPTKTYDVERQTTVREEGMSLRDYFAAKAMQAILSMPEALQEDSGNVAIAAYAMADAMLKERAK